MSIFLPLYIYPGPGAWDPLFAAATSHPDVSFTVVLNPCSGPCNGSLPDSSYLSAIPRLTSYENIRTLGYVATNYTSKPVASVVSEIETYAAWPKIANNTGLKLGGIFLDETPSVYENAKYEYLKKAGAAVRNGTRFKDRFVVHNPGLLPSDLLTSKPAPKPKAAPKPAPAQPSYLNLTDITVLYEESFTNLLAASTFDTLQTHSLDRSKLAVLVHGVPKLLSETVLRFLVEQVEDMADWVFLTDYTGGGNEGEEGEEGTKEKEEYYHGFGGGFGKIVGFVGGD